MRLVVESAATGFSFLRKEFQKPLYILMGIGSLFLIITCLNLASLMLARGVGRFSEMNLRAALGASRIRLICGQLAECLLISLGGAIASLPIAWWASRWFAKFVWTGIVPLRLDISPDFRVLAVTATIAAGTAVLFGLPPAIYVARASNATLLQSKATFPKRTGRFRRWLICAEVGLSFVLLVVAGLFVRSLEKLRNISPGFREADIILLELLPQPNGYRSLDNEVYYRELIGRLSQLPGVSSVGLSHLMPTAKFEWNETVVPNLENGDNQGVVSKYEMVSPEFFETMGMRLVGGRGFTWMDNERAPRVAIVSASLAHRLFPKGNAVGQHIRVGSEPQRQDTEIVAIVSDASIWDIRASRPFAVFVPYLQEPRFAGWPIVEVRVDRALPQMTNQLRHEIEILGHEYPITIRSLQQQLNASLAGERVAALVGEVFGAFGLVLTLVGVYGLVSNSTSNRTREIGVRMAVGGQPFDILKMVVLEALQSMLIGMMAGFPIALAIGRLISNMTFGVSYHDAMTLAAVSAVLLVVGFLAAYLPARTASHLDPSVSLRHE